MIILIRQIRSDLNLHRSLLIIMDYVPTHDEFLKKATSLSDQECLEYCDEILSHNVHTASVLLMKSAVLIRLKKFEDTISCCNKRIDLSDENGEVRIAYDNKGLALSRLGKFTEALECHKKSFESGGKHKVNFVNTSMALGGLGRYEESLENCEKALEIDPNYSMAWNNKGYYLHKVGKSEEGLKDVEKALELDPTDEDALESKQEIIAALG